MKFLKPYFLFTALFIIQYSALPQSNSGAGQATTPGIDSMKQQLALATDDSVKIKLLKQIGFDYEPFSIDSALKYDSAYVLLTRARQGKYPVEYSQALASISTAYATKGKFADALDALFKALAIAKENNDAWNTARAYRRLGFVYLQMENYRKAVQFCALALQIDATTNKSSAAIDRIFMAKMYEKLNISDSAVYYAEKTLQDKDFGFGIHEPCRVLGDIAFKKSDFAKAMAFYRQGLPGSIANKDLTTNSEINAGIARVFIQSNQLDSAKHYADAAFKAAAEVSYKNGIIASTAILAELYSKEQPSKALEYYKIMMAAKDSLFGTANMETIQNLVEHEGARQREAEAAALAYRNRLRWIAVLAGLAGLLVIAFILFRSNRQKQKANLLLNSQKQQIEKTLAELTSTQKQLIQSEKMASLGELTAGIAHEIQNPLNFVNNFSDISKELLEELKAERSKPKEERDDNLQNELINDVIANEEKINHHGKRADAIVKGMLQHSRSSTGQKGLTDINALCDEYLRLAYHGLRAKDKSFNATFETNFDDSLPRINVVPQEIGRVILNLINNAFYAVNERKKQNEEKYEPTLLISTKKSGDQVEIKIVDNGNGIPQNIIDKIFQPFFTTKPTGQGTGLGLSLSYDIVKAHGGKINVESREGDGTAFTIQLPVA